jgi:hypothetical protein
MHCDTVVHPTCSHFFPWLPSCLPETLAANSRELRDLSRVIPIGPPPAAHGPSPTKPNTEKVERGTLLCASVPCPARSAAPRAPPPPWRARTRADPPLERRPPKSTGDGRVQMPQGNYSPSLPADPWPEPPWLLGSSYIAPPAARADLGSGVRGGRVRQRRGPDPAKRRARGADFGGTVWVHGGRLGGFLHAHPLE